jgi:serine/threonine protein phosphatase PrpC
MHSDERPRATCALCLIQNGSALWAHVGDSRVYHLRDDRVLERTRDHSHVEVLLQDGLITEEEILSHPLRNFVECCLGGDSALPELSMSVPARLDDGDIILVCSDGLWSGVSDEEIGAFYQPKEGSLGACLEALSFAALDACAPWGDNTTVAVMRVGPDADTDAD